MLYLFSGIDTFRLLQRVKILEGEFSYAYPGGQKLVIDLEDKWDEETRSQLVSALSPDLFATSYFVLIRGGEVLEEKQGALLSDLLSSRDSSMTVVLTLSLGNKKKLPKWWLSLLENRGAKEETFGTLSGIECQQYIEKVLKDFDPKITLEPRAKTFLAETLAYDTGRLTQELERLALIAPEEGITLAQVEESIVPTREAVTFQALDALIQGNRARAISLFRREETEADAPFALLGLCSWQVRRLIAIKELSEEGKNAGDIARELKTSPYPIQKTLPLVARFSFPRLRRALALLSEFDHALKTGRMQPGVALDLFVWKF